MIACMFIHLYNHFYYSNAAQGHTERNPITNQPSTHNSNITSQFGPIPISKTVLSCKTGPKVDLVVLSVNPHIRSNLNILSMKYPKMLNLIKLEVTMLRVWYSENHVEKNGDRRRIWTSQPEKSIHSGINGC